jgi:hypothetical protein
MRTIQELEFFQNFFSKGQYFKEINGHYSAEYYQKYFLKEADYEDS